MSETRKGYFPPDGIMGRGDKEEHRINELAAICFSEAAGDAFLKYLRKITIERVHGPSFDPNQLIHLEGARWLVGIIEQRIQHGRERKPNVSEKPPEQNVFKRSRQ